MDIQLIAIVIIALLVISLMVDFNTEAIIKDIHLK